MKVNPNRSNKPLIYLVLVFLIPMIISFVLYNFHGYFHMKTINQGIILAPPINAPYLSTSKNNEKIWQIIYISTENCDARCKEIDYKLHQVKKALGKDSNRVQVLRVDNNNQIDTLTKAFATQGEEGFIVRGKIYLIDPTDNIFMYYPEDEDPMNVLKDLKRVLEVSQIG